MAPRHHLSMPTMPWETGGGAQQPPPYLRYGGGATPAHSRFVEGSMNDRVSAAPPPVFMGPNEAAIWERQFYPEAQRPQTRTGGHHRSKSHAQLQQHHQQQPVTTKKSGFFAPLWDGVRDKLLSKAKSSGNIGTKAGQRSDRVVVEDVIMEADPVSPETKPVAPAAGVAYPTREEVMESYKSLMASGFFDAHAIKGTRHPLRTSAPLATTGRADQSSSFAQRMQQQSGKGPAFSPADLYPSPVSPSMSSGPPRTSFSSQRRQQIYEAPDRMEEDKDEEKTAPSPYRGTKRGVPSDADAPAETGTGARKLVKRLRRSPSRVSIDMPAPPPTGHSFSSFGGGLTYSASSFAMRSSRPSTASHVGAATASAASSIFGGNGAPSFTTSFATTIDDATPVAPSKRSSMTKLSKLSKISWDKEKGNSSSGGGKKRRGLLGLGRRTPRSPAAAATTKTASAPTTTGVSEVDDKGEKTDNEDVDPMALDSEPEILTATAVRIRPGQRVSSWGKTGPAAFHYPQRVRGPGEPLSVVPDPNRGIPVVPRIPSEFSSTHPGTATSSGQAGDVVTEGKEKMTHNRDSGLGEDVENLARVW